MTAHDLAADWSWMHDHIGFRLQRGRRVWEVAEYGTTPNVRIGRVDSGKYGLCQYERMIDPATPVVLIPRTNGPDRAYERHNLTPRLNHPTPE